MVLQIYNSLTRRKEKFETLEPNKVRMYVCGPTVYDKAHVGHAMSVIVFDIIRRYLEYRGYNVKLVMNYTDVDDKIIKKAQELGVDPFDLANSYIDEFKQHLIDLNILSASIYPRATDEIEKIIEMVQDLIDKGNAYEADGDVYFFVSSDDDYGKLSGRKLEDMQSGYRIDIDQRKETPMDFALWKASKPGEPAWDSPWGKGRPGWHIECSAMSLHHLGEQIDIHGGGTDLVFPHHENEIAQTESLTGKPFARYWVHNGMLQLSGEKMSKSVGNLVTIDEFLGEYEPDILRIMILNSSYRSPLKFGDETIDQAKRALGRLKTALRPALPGAEISSSNLLMDQISEVQENFINSMDDDFNTASALGNLFDFVRSINQARDNGVTDEVLTPAQDKFLELTGIFGLQLDNKPIVRESRIAPFINLLIEIRSKLREQELWELSDEIRDRLLDSDIILEDGKSGTTRRWK